MFGRWRGRVGGSLPFEHRRRRTHRSGEMLNASVRNRRSNGVDKSTLRMPREVNTQVVRCWTLPFLATFVWGDVDVAVS